MAITKGEKLVAQNKKAFHDYHIEERYETGVVLTGTEIKSVRTGKVNMRDSFAQIRRGEVFLHNMHISPYEQGNRYNHEPLRTRKLLMNRQEINKLIGMIKAKGYTLVPIKIYLKNGLAKVEIALAKGKKEYDKRETIKQRDANREMAKAIKERLR